VDDVVYTLDVRNEKQVAWFRITGGVVCLAGALAIGSLGPPLVGWVVVLIGVAAGLGWLVAGARGLRRAKAPTRYFVALREAALELGDGPRVVSVPWDELLSAEVDEERLVVVLRRKDKDPVLLEPRFPKLSVYDLAKAVQERVRG
jgi:hypothetical protein